MGTLTAKAGVDLNGLAPEGYVILGAVERASRTFNVDLVVTSANRPLDADSQHSKGKAIDVRTSNLTSAQILSMFYWLAAELGPGFTVLYEVPNLTNVPAELRAIAFVNPSASAIHFHIGAKRT